MVSSERFIDALTERRFGPYLGVPCSFLKPFINYVIDRQDLDYIPATNEGEAVAIASGAYLAGRRPVVMLQNSGVGNMINPLTSLSFTYRMPLLLIVTLRGEPGLKDEPQHELMGQITAQLLSTVRVENEQFPGDDVEVVPKIDHALGRMRETGLPYAFIMRKGSVDAYDLQGKQARPSLQMGEVMSGGPIPADPPFRREAVAAIADLVGDETLTIATTGKAGRELFYHRDRATNFYMVGSMGCASSMALGISLYCREKPIVVLDGDGAALMRMEALASIGRLRPGNLVHVILDNEAYDSTGGQTTISGSVSFPHVATACGYATGCSVGRLRDLINEVERALLGRGPHLIHVRVRKGADPDLGRPTIKPPEAARRFREAIASLASE